MSLYKPKGIDVWYVNISHPSLPRVRRSTGTNDRKEAQRIHDQIKAELWSAPVLKGNTWGAAVILWCERKPRSDSELYSLRKFGQHFPDRPIEQVTRDELERALAFCKTAGTYNRYRAMVMAVLNCAVDEEWIDKAPKLPAKTNKTKPRAWLTPQQWDKLYLELPEHLRGPADFALQTGLRQANVLGLTWDRVDLKRRVIWVEAEDTKAKKPIAVPLSDHAHEILQTLHNKEDRDPAWVFTHNGKPFKKVKTAFQAACIRAGVGSVLDVGGEYRYQGFTWHGLRHTWATWHIQNETPLDVVQKLGGWADLRMVMNYAHHSPGYLAQYANNIKKES